MSSPYQSPGPLLETGQSLCKDVMAVLEYFNALGFSWYPGIVDLKADQKCHSDDVQPPSGDKCRLMEALCREAQACRKCRLHQERKQAVCGEGSFDARLMFIGEAPGREEDAQGLPFVGDAGILLSRLIEKMGLKRKEVYIANIIKCRPPLNRDPDEEEVSSCMPFLERQIEIISPVMIVALGRIALQSLMRDPKLKITAVRGRFFEYKGIQLMPTYHPAYLLRNPSDKWQTWADMQKVMEKLGSGRL